MPGEGTMQNLAVVKSLEAPSRISLDDFSTYTRHIAERMRVIGKPLPPLLILHVSESVAVGLGVASTGVIRRTRLANGGPQSYYEIWLVEKVGVADYVSLLESLLKDHFALHKSDL
jgi:hypothetical protein